MLKNQDGSIIDAMPCEECSEPRLMDELIKNRERMVVCNEVDATCWNAGDLRTCEGCERIFEEGDIMSNDWADRNLCHDCLIQDREARQTERDQEWDYWHA